MINTKKRIVIAHPGKQHSLRLAEALDKSNLIEIRYITTVYYKKKSLIMHFVKKFLDKNNRKRLDTRKSKFINDQKIITFYQVSGLIEIFLSRFDKKKKLYNAWRKYLSKRFGKKVAKYAIKFNADAVVCYDTNAKDCFEYLSKKAPSVIRILDSSAANRIFMKSIYEKDMEINKQFASKLKSEIGFWIEEKEQYYFAEEMMFSQYIIAPSKFVKKSYIETGFDFRNIIVCPYGVDLSEFPYQERNIKKENEIIKFVFVGGTKQLKGISYLLEAFSKIHPEKAELTIVGNLNISKELMHENLEHVKFTGLVLHHQVSQILRDMDVLIFPSLGEGMSLSILEAMSCGVPVICTENSGTNDFIEEGVNGFVIPIQDSGEIIKKVNWFIENRSMIPSMAESANRTTKNYNWNNYNNCITRSIADILEHCPNTSY